jgi:dihydroxyacetone kinase phosphoprotein-dependent L subunit
MSATGLRACVLAAADAVEAARDELGRLDAVAGDGDHGVTMTLGARAVRARLDEQPDVAGVDLLAAIAPAFASVGGAIGPIYATALLRLAGVARSIPSGPDAPTVAQARAAAEAVQAGIEKLGGARPGDKTVLDAVAPVADALRAAEAEASSLAVALRAAVDAACAGAAATADMTARVGRASRLGDRSRGWQDPGATSFALILEAAVRAWTGETEPERA